MHDRYRASSQSSRAPSIRLELQHLGWVYGRWAAFIDDRSFGFRDTFHLALLAQVRLELREDSEHVKERLSSRRAGINWLLGCLEAGALRLH